LPGIAVARSSSGGEIITPWSRGDMCAIFAFGNPLPFAVGRTCCSSIEVRNFSLFYPILFILLTFDTKFCFQYRLLFVKSGGQHVSPRSSGMRI
jgi:hypothetical protein